MTISKRLYSSIPLLVIGLLIAKTKIIFGDGCQGVIDAVLFFFLTSIYVLLLIIFVTISAVKSFRKNAEFNYYPLFTTFIVAITVFLTTFIAGKFESATTLFYAVPTLSSNCTLILRKDKTFKIEIKEIEYACFYKGSYEILGDTLQLLRQDIGTKTDNTFTNKYLVDKNKLIPINKSGKDTPQNLIIYYGKK